MPDTFHRYPFPSEGSEQAQNDSAVRDPEKRYGGLTRAEYLKFQGKESRRVLEEYVAKNPSDKKNAALLDKLRKLDASE